MSDFQAFSFPVGVAVSVITDSGTVFTGTILRIRHHDDCNELGIQFLFLQLTAAVGPYVVGEIVALNRNLIISIGPIIAS